MNDDPTSRVRRDIGGWISGGCAPVPGAYDGGMDDLIAFVNARLDEDEAIARATIEPRRWHRDSDGNVQDEDARGGGNAYIACGPYGRGLADADAEHIIRHDPARVLREVAAKRALVHRHAAERHEDCDTLRTLATVWSDHPDYRAGWKP